MQSVDAPAPLSLTLAKFGSVITVGVWTLLFPGMACQSNSVVSTMTSFNLDSLWVACFSCSNDDFLTAHFVYFFKITFAT